MSGNISLCPFCCHIPLNVDTLERLRTEPRPRSALEGSRGVPLDGSPTPNLIAGDRAVFALGKAERVLSSGCPLCNITATAVQDIKRVMGWQDLKDDTPLTLTWSHEGPSSKGVFKVNDKDNIYICFTEESCAGPSTKDLSLSTACLIRPTPARFEPSNITRWIADCKRLHGPECNEHNSMTGPIKQFYRVLELMRFVDVHKLCIVECREAVKYVALSYVWGATPTTRLTTTNQDYLYTPGSLPDFTLPNTIWDAINVTKACGEQFLWVDALCLIQDNAGDLEIGIHVMDLICKSACS